jgi:hypothetical protein
MIELLLAAGLFSILMLALLRLVDTTLTIWSRTDQARELSEMGAGALDLLAADLAALEGGARGDLVADWWLFDLDRDGIEGTPAPRLRLVRHRGAAGLQRLASGRPGADFETFERALVEVGWALLPASSDVPEERGLFTLVRGERLVSDAETLSYFAPGFFGPSGKPVPGSLLEVTGGALWLDLMFASQTSVLHEGWALGDGLAHCSASWDAWNRARPDAERSVFNQPAAGMPAAKEAPLLPRRVRIELELERPRDLRLRTRLALPATAGATDVTVRDGRRLPEVGRMIRIDDEWLEILAKAEERISVRRGRRGTRPAEHAAEALVHHGWRAVREVPIDMTREDWDL